MALDILLVYPPPVNPAAFDTRIPVFFNAVTIVNLYFIAPHKIYTRVRMSRDAEFNVRLNVAELLFGRNIFVPARWSVDEHALSGRDSELL